MHPLETILLGMVMMLSGATTDSEKRYTSNLDIKAPTAMVRLTMCDPAVKVRQAKKPVGMFVRCMTNTRQWEEGWTDLPERGGMLVWRGIVAGPQQPRKILPRPKKQKHSDEIFDFDNDFEAEI